MRSSLFAAALLLLAFAVPAPSAALGCAYRALDPVSALAVNDPATLPATLAWTGAAPGCLTNVTVERSTNGGPFETLATLARDATTFQDDSAVDCTTAVYRVVQHNNVGASPAVDVDGSRHHGPPAAPTPTVTTSGYSSFLYARVAIDRPSEACMPTRYEVARTVDGATTALTPPYPMYPYLYDSLVVGCEEVTYWVAAHNAGGRTTATVTATMPDVPPRMDLAHVRPEPYNLTTMRVRWDTSPGCAATSFEVRVQGQVVATLDGSARTFDVRRITPCMQVNVAITAMRGDAASYPSYDWFIHQPLGACPTALPYAPLPLEP